MQYKNTKHLGQDIQHQKKNFSNTYWETHNISLI